MRAKSANSGHRSPDQGGPASHLGHSLPSCADHQQVRRTGLVAARRDAKNRCADADSGHRAGPRSSPFWELAGRWHDSTKSRKTAPETSTPGDRRLELADLAGIWAPWDG